MPDSLAHQVPSDMCLLLRADAEQSWLRREVIPVLDELEAYGQLAEERTGAALAYLEAMWIEATIRARATDTANSELSALGRGDAHGLSSAAARYHMAVRVLRELAATRVGAFLQGAAEPADGQAEEQAMLAEAQAAGGCAPRAA